MTSLRKNRTLFIDKEAASALELVSNGLLSPVTKLMCEKGSKDVLKPFWLYRVMQYRQVADKN